MKMTREELAANRPDDIPPVSNFYRIYGMSFEEVRDGVKSSESSTGDEEGNTIATENVSGEE